MVHTIVVCQSNRDLHVTVLAVKEFPNVPRFRPHRVGFIGI